MHYCAPGKRLKDHILCTMISLISDQIRATCLSTVGGSSLQAAVLNLVIGCFSKPVWSIFE